MFFVTHIEGESKPRLFLFYGGGHKICFYTYIIRLESLANYQIASNLYIMRSNVIRRVWIEIDVSFQINSNLSKFNDDFKSRKNFVKTQRKHESSF
jgi:hypothetical protein